jgi:NTE family protein
MLRQNTPVRPAIQAGCSHVLVIGIDKPGQHSSVEGHVTPTFAFIAGKALNAILMDPVDRDLRQVEKINEIVRWGREKYGEEFAQALMADKGMSEVNILRVSPSVDLGRLARDQFKAHPPKVSAPVRALLSLLADPANVGESDLLSYLLFDHAYTGAAEQLGFEDARRAEEVLARFITAEVPPPAG